MTPAFLGSNFLNNLPLYLGLYGISRGQFTSTCNNAKVEAKKWVHWYTFISIFF
jgi:hypothetical protein